MSQSHDEYATYYGNQILSRIRSAHPDFKQIFSASLTRTGDWDWPRPDYVCYDEELRATYALEFKPPFQSKREYLTGLGQSIAYLQKHTYSGLIIPYYADDGFPIAEFISKTLFSEEFSNVPTSLYAYYNDTNDINILRPITNLRTTGTTPLEKDVTETFWCWWRDMSHYELYDLLYLSFVFSRETGDIYTKFIYPKFYNAMINSNTRQWNGTPRKRTPTEQSKKSEKQNYKIPLVQLGLWSRSEGRLTDLGFKLLEIGTKYGSDSQKYIDYLTYLVLVNGKHLDLIQLIENFQTNNNISSNSSQHSLDIEKYLTEQGCIGKRKPTAIKTGAKNSYMRDEMKLWNKLGLLNHCSNKSYFFPNRGYVFDWKRITDILKNYNLY